MDRLFCRLLPGCTTFGTHRRLFAFFLLAPQNISLTERSQLQRAKQLQFLRNQGLIREDSEIRGGAGAASVTDDGNTSVASVPRSAVSSAVSFTH